MSNVLITQPIGAEALSALADAGVPYRVNDSGAPWTPDQLQTAVSTAAALICLLTDQIDTAVLDAAPQLQLAANVAVGYDNIDVPAATARGVWVTNTPDVLTETTADLAFALLLAIARRIPQADAYMRAGRYTRFELFPEMMGVDVYGKTLGIVGMGRIGTAVARRGTLGFGMRVLYTARQPKPAAEAEFGAQRVDLPQLLRASDFVSLHAPLTRETRHLITLAELKQMQPHACLVNTARGPMIKEADLAQALANGLVRGAALDVFEEEPRLHPDLVAVRDRLVVAPHVGSATIETRRRMAETAVANVIAWWNGRTPPNVLNPDAVQNREQ